MTYRACLIFTLMTLSVVSGCALFAPKSKDVESLAALKPDSHNVGPVLTKHVVRMQTAIVTSTPDDENLRSLVWEELDESGPMKPEDRIRLNQSGLRVGVSGGTLPWAIRGMLPESDQPAISATVGQKSDRRIGMQIAVPEGSDSRIELPSSGESIVIPPNKLAGLIKGGELEKVSCSFHVEPVEHSPHWTVLKVVPVVRYGSLVTRYNLDDDSLAAGRGQIGHRQKVHPLYEQQFQVKLHVGESLVIGYESLNEWTVGKMLLQSENLTTIKEQLVVIQLLGIEQMEAQGAMTIDHQRF